MNSINRTVVVERDSRALTTRVIKALELIENPEWTPDGQVSPEQFGAVGDGIADDTAAIQQAMNSPMPLVFRFGARHRVSNTIYVPAWKYVNMNGATMIRGFRSRWIMENRNARSLAIDEGIRLHNISFEDDGTNDTRGNFLMMSGVKDLIVNGFRVRASSPNLPGEQLGAWCSYYEGDDISISGVDVDTRLCGLYSDGIHLGVVNRLTIDSGYRILSGDDAIALHHPPAAWDNIHANGVSNGISIGSGYVESVNANGVRIGAWVDSGSLTAWNNVTIGPVTFGPCGTHPIRLEDNRDGAANRSTNITVIVGGVASAASLRLLSIVGNPSGDVAANVSKKNFNRVAISGLKGAVNNSTGVFVDVWGVDDLSLENFDIAALVGMVATTPRIRLRQIRRLNIRSSLFLPETSGTALLLNQVENARLQGVDLLCGGAATGIQVNNAAGDTSSITMTGGSNRGATTAFAATIGGTFNEAVISGTDVLATTRTNAAFRGATRFVWSIASGQPAT